MTWKALLTPRRILNLLLLLLLVLSSLLLSSLKAHADPFSTVPEPIMDGYMQEISDRFSYYDSTKNQWHGAYFNVGDGVAQIYWAYGGSVVTVEAGKYICMNPVDTNDNCNINITETETSIYIGSTHNFMLWEVLEDGSLVEPSWLGFAHPSFSGGHDGADSYIVVNGITGYGEDPDRVSGEDLTDIHTCFPPDTITDLGFYTNLKFTNFSEGCMPPPDPVCGEGEFEGTTGTWPDCVPITEPPVGGGGMTQDELRELMHEYSVKAGGLAVAVGVSYLIVKQFRWRW